MEEKIKTEEVKVKEDDLIDKANIAAQRIEDANLRLSELLDRQEKIKVREIMGGQSAAGTPVVEKTKEEKAIDSARAMLKGTGYDDILFPEKTNGDIKNGK